MRFDRLDLNLLVALDALLETQSVSEAGRRLFLSQPAVTGALNRLRIFFDDELLVQSGRRMVLTRRAEELSGPVRQALAFIRSEITQPDQFDPVTANRHFIIAVSDYAYAILVADALSAASSVAPGISFEIIPPGSLAAERFERGEIDLFVTVEPFAIGKHPRQRLWRDDEVIISWTGSVHPCDISADAFFAAGHAVATFGPDRLLSMSDGYIKKLDRGRRVEILLSSFSLLPMAIVGTNRLATMHRLYAEHFAARYPIRLHEFWTPLPEIVEIAQWHNVRRKDPGVKWLVDLMTDQAAGLPASSRLSDESAPGH